MCSEFSKDLRKTPNPCAIMNTQYFDRLLVGAGFFFRVYMCVCAISIFDMEMTVWQQQQQRGIPRFFDDLTDYVNMQRDGFRERTTQK